jgi:predicted transcriptional regulator
MLVAERRRAEALARKEAEAKTGGPAPPPQSQAAAEPAPPPSSPELRVQSPALAPTEPHLVIVHGANQTAKTRPDSAALDSTVDFDPTSTVDDLPTSTVDVYPKSTITNLWRAENGALFPASRVRRISRAQDALSRPEEAVFDFLWGPKNTAKDEYRLTEAGYTAIAKDTRLAKRNVPPVIERLIEKGFLRLEKKAVDRVPNKYRVLSYRAALDELARRGRTHVIRSGNGVLFAHPITAAITRADVGSKSTVDAGAKSTVDVDPSSTVDVDQQSTVDPTSTVTVDVDQSSTVDAASTPFRHKKEMSEKATSSSSFFSEIATAVRKIAPEADDDYVVTLIDKCRSDATDASADEIAHFIRLKGNQALNSRRVRSVTGFLWEAVPKCLAGTMLADYREGKRLEREQEITAWREIMADPESNDELKATAQGELERLEAV